MKVLLAIVCILAPLFIGCWAASMFPFPPWLALFAGWIIGMRTAAAIAEWGEQ